MVVEKQKQIKTTPEDLLYTELNNIALEISSKFDAERPAREPYDHSLYNWASEIHHPCKKFLVHCRVDWKDRQIMDINGRWRVEEGNDKEWAVKKWLGNIGFEIIQSQKKFTTDDVGLKEYQHLKISGRVDGFIPTMRELPKPFNHIREIPVEVKSVSPHYWKSTETIEDIKRHSKFWISKIPSQLNTYFILSGSPCGLLVLATFGKRPRVLPMLFDEELWEYDQRIVEAVNKHVKAGTYPEPMPFDSTVCGMCDFNHICNPLQVKKNLIELKDIDEIELELYLELREQRDHYEELRKRLIGNMENPGKYFGKEAFISDIVINTKKSMRSKYPRIPKELKELYREEYELIQTTIERIAK